LSASATSRTTGAPTTTIGVLLRKQESAPIATSISQMPCAPSRLHIAIAIAIARSSSPESSSA